MQSSKVNYQKNMNLAYVHMAYNNTNTAVASCSSFIISSPLCNFSADPFYSVDVIAKRHFKPSPLFRTIPTGKGSANASQETKFSLDYDNTQANYSSPYKGILAAMLGQYLSP